MTRKTNRNTNETNYRRLMSLLVWKPKGSSRGIPDWSIVTREVYQDEVLELKSFLRTAVDQMREAGIDERYVKAIEDFYLGEVNILDSKHYLYKDAGVVA